MVTCLGMKRTEEIKWRAFRLLDLFTPKKGNQKNMNSLTEGLTPLVSAKKVDNGVKGFYKINDVDIYNGHCITLNNDGDGGAGLSFYQPNSFALDSHVTALYPNEPISKHVLLFMACCISKQSVLFGHGHSINSTRLNQLTIMLPCIDDTPDYAYMDDYMKHREQKLLSRYKKYMQKKSFQTLEKLQIKNIGGFKIDELFTIFPGVRLIKQDQLPGTMPFVGSTDSNNGITNFCGNRNASEDRNLLGVNYNGSVVENFYHPYKALFSDDVKRFHLKNYEGNKYVYLYLKNSILKQKMIYQYGYKFNEQRMRGQIIQIPINDVGQPDYEYMENYMRIVENRLLRRYIDKRLNKLQEG